MKLSGKKIAIISSEAWGQIFVSKHYYARVLSRDNKVYFINPPSISWNPKSLLKTPVSVKSVSTNLEVIDYGNPIPRLALMPLFFQNLIFKKIIRDIVKTIEGDDLDIIWSFDLKRFYDLKAWPAVKRIFHAVELIDHKFFLNDAPYRHQVVKSADFVISIANLISNQAKKYNPKVLNLNHGIDSARFESNKDHVSLPGTSKIKAGFVGNFQVSFDFDLLKEIAESNQDVDFIMIGPTTDSNLGQLIDQSKKGIENFKNITNVYFIGKVASDSLPTYLDQIDMNLIFYSDEYSDGHCNPHKLMMYFYYGKVTVSSFIDQYKNDPTLVQMTTRNKELPALFKTVKENLEIHNSELSMGYRKKFAQDHDYDHLVSTIESFIN